MLMQANQRVYLSPSGKHLDGHALVPLAFGEDCIGLGGKLFQFHHRVWWVAATLVANSAPKMLMPGSCERWHEQSDGAWFVFWQRHGFLPSGPRTSGFHFQFPAPDQGFCK